jgi:hypothetical protein
MITVKDIKEAISTLPDPDFSELRHWLLEKDWQKWDQQIVEDAESGKLNFLVEEARTETLKDL